MAGRPRGLIASAVTAAGIFFMLPAGARAETRTFVDTTPLAPMDGGVQGPAIEYPSTIEVGGVAGTVTGVRVTLFAYGSASPDDADVGISGPNGQTVMLMSDACGVSDLNESTPTYGHTWTFDDAAPTLLSDAAPCPNSAEQSFRPSNFVGSGDLGDDFSLAAGGPPPPYLNRLSALAGGSPNGAWKLFMFDDNPGIFGFEIAGWALTLDVDPPAPPSNDFAIGALDGARLSVDLPSAGTVTVFEDSDTGLLKTTSVTGGPGTIAIDLQLTKPGKRKLRSTRKVKVDAGVSFNPVGGTPKTLTTPVTLKK